ncbi:hypothetical protein HDU93_006638 [Gonapodya sp. JEL0774]|nr:hypothetical protein HDU93_006638 [Gonapodya sp. JEL0774]
MRRLLLPSLLLVVIRIAYCPFVVFDENFTADPRYAEPGWYIGVVLIEQLVLMLFAHPDQLLYLDIPAVRLLPRRAVDAATLPAAAG